MSGIDLHNIKIVPPWESVIEECARQLQDSEARSGRLRACLEYFQARKASGDPFPGLEVRREKRLLPATQNLRTTRRTIALRRAPLYGIEGWKTKKEAA